VGEGLKPCRRSWSTLLFLALNYGHVPKSASYLWEIEWDSAPFHVWKLHSRSWLSRITSSFQSLLANPPTSWHLSELNAFVCMKQINILKDVDGVRGLGEMPFLRAVKHYCSRCSPSTLCKLWRRLSCEWNTDYNVLYVMDVIKLSIALIYPFLCILVNYGYRHPSEAEQRCIWRFMRWNDSGTRALVWRMGRRQAIL
jgi:hypothetical protein